QRRARDLEGHGPRVPGVSSAAGCSCDRAHRAFHHQAHGMELLRLDTHGVRFGAVWVFAWLLTMLLAAEPAPSAAEEMTGTVARVLSGDTLVVSDGKGELEIRLADIGAPQGSEYYTPASRMLLSNMVSGKTVRVVITGRDGSNRAF